MCTSYTDYSIVLWWMEWDVSWGMRGVSRLSQSATSLLLKGIIVCGWVGKQIYWRANGRERSEQTQLHGKRVSTDVDKYVCAFSIFLDLSLRYLGDQSMKSTSLFPLASLLLSPCKSHFSFALTYLSWGTIFWRCLKATCRNTHRLNVDSTR